MAPTEHTIVNEEGDIEHVKGSYVKAAAKEDKDDILGSIVPGDKKGSLVEKKKEEEATVAPTEVKKEEKKKEEVVEAPKEVAKPKEVQVPEKKMSLKDKLLAKKS